MNERANELIQKYLDEALSDNELAALQAMIAEDPTVAESFAQATRMDAALSSLLGEDAAVRDLTAFARQIQDESLTRPAQVSSPHRDSNRYAIFTWSTVAAVLLIVIGGFALWWSVNDDQREVADTHSVISGQVFTNGSTSDQIRDGEEIRVGEGGPAVIRLADGSRAELETASRAVLRTGIEDTRQTVELVEGSGTFRVAKGSRQFKVTTSIGDVTVLGTEFFVHLLPTDARRHDIPSNETDEQKIRPTEKGDEEMKKAALMAVVVLSGVVQVDVGGKTYTLTGGDGQAFAEEDNRRAPAIAGAVKAVDAEKGTITLAGKTKEGRVVEPDKTYVVAGGAKKQLAGVKAGNQVTLTLSNDKQTVVRVAVRQPRRGGEGEREREGKPRPRNTGGAFGGAEGGSLTLIQRGDSGERSLKFTVTNDTNIVIETTDDIEIKVRREEGERTVKRPKLADAKLTDLKDGQRITVTHDASGKALRVLGHRPVKKVGEGERDG